MKRYKALTTVEFGTGCGLRITVAQAKARAANLDGFDPGKKKGTTIVDVTVLHNIQFKAGDMFEYGGPASRRLEGSMMEVDENGYPVGDEGSSSGGGSEGGAGDGGGGGAAVTLTLPDGTETVEADGIICITLPTGTTELALSNGETVAVPGGVVLLSLAADGTLSPPVGDPLALPDGTAVLAPDGSPLNPGGGNG